MKYKNTLIKNIYYMLSYAFQELKRQNYEDVGKENFEHIEDLMAEILYRGVSLQLKQGFHKEYIDKIEDLSTVKGRIDMSGTMRLRLANKMNICCSYDELSENILMNQIIKTTLVFLMYNRDVNAIRKNQIKSVLPYFSGVDTVELKKIRWNTLRFDRSLGTYKMLINICYFVFHAFILSEQGEYRMETFTHDYMEMLFQRFVLKYYQIEHEKELIAKSLEVKWDVDYVGEVTNNEFLPRMMTDITLANKADDRILIIDTKFYTHITNENYGKKSINSAHLYQIFAYVKNRDTKKSGDVSGMLLYAKTEDDIIPTLDEVIGGNRIMVNYLDLNQDFNLIKKRLDEFCI